MSYRRSGNPLRATAYVDGFNLYFGLRQAGWRRYYWLDVEALCQSFCRPGTALTRTLYFTANISRPPAKVRRQQAFLDALAAYRKVEIVRGHYLEKPRVCAACGASWMQQEEKMTDVAIATHLLTDAFLDRFDVAFVISADSDLVPPIQQIREHLPSKRLVVGFPPKRSSNHLRRTAHNWFYVSESSLAGAQLPDPVVLPNGHEIRRPMGWK